MILQVIDQSWKNHINQLDSLRQNIGFRSYAGKDPRLEYKREAFEMFEQLLETIKKESTRFLCRVEVKPEDEQEIEKMKSREVLEKLKQCMKILHQHLWITLCLTNRYLITINQ